MKIILKCTTDSNEDIREEMEVDGERSLYAGPLWECPEDAIIGRALISCSDVINYMKMAHAAGLQGEEFVVEEVKEDD